MTIERVVTSSGHADVTGVGYRPVGEVMCEGHRLAGAHRFETQLLLGAGSLANDAQLTEHDGEWRVHGDPTEAAFLVAAHKLDGTTGQMSRFERQAEIPFTSERKLMSTLHRAKDDGTSLLLTKGAPDVLLGMCTSLQVGRATVPLTDEGRTERLTEVRLSRLSWNLRWRSPA